jgi:hypothetical protein
LLSKLSRLLSAGVAGAVLVIAAAAIIYGALAAAIGAWF